jgi:hypothetical protein
MPRRWRKEKKDRAKEKGCSQGSLSGSSAQVQWPLSQAGGINTAE